MKTEEIIEEIRLVLSGGIVDIEVDDKTLEKVVNKSLRELNRYCIESRLVTIPFSKCIDMSEYNVRYIADVYRATPLGNGKDSTSENIGISTVDPMMAQWMLYSNGYSMYNFNDWIANYEAYVTLNRISNTNSTDLAFMYDKDEQKLYINTTDTPVNITIRYVPYFNLPEELKTDYWIDLLVRLSVAYTKIILGRIRSKYTQTNALWTMDGATMLEEGNKELENLQEILRANAKVTFPLD